MRESIPSARSLVIMLMLSGVFSLIGGAGQLKAQPTGLDDDPGSAVPLDGGASLLLGAGVAYGIARAGKKRRMGGKRVKYRPRP